MSLNILHSSTRNFISYVKKNCTNANGFDKKLCQHFIDKMRYFGKIQNKDTILFQQLISNEISTPDAILNCSINPYGVTLNFGIYEFPDSTKNQTDGHGISLEGRKSIANWINIYIGNNNFNEDPENQWILIFRFFAVFLSKFMIVANHNDDTYRRNILFNLVKYLKNEFNNIDTNSFWDQTYKTAPKPYVKFLDHLYGLMEVLLNDPNCENKLHSLIEYASNSFP
jgi:hypothetical protein